MIVRRLHEALAAVCPIQGVTLGVRHDRSTWVIAFDPAATEAQRAAAADVLGTFDADAPVPRSAPALQLRYALNTLGKRADWEAAVASQSQATRDYWETEPNPPESSPKLRRVAAAAGIDLVGVFDRALGG